MKGTPLPSDKPLVVMNLRARADCHQMVFVMYAAILADGRKPSFVMIHTL
jgi:hypothetical protein